MTAVLTAPNPAPTAPTIARATPGLARNLRHAFARFMLKGGVDRHTLSRAIGHSRESTTSQFYLDDDTELRQAAAEVAGQSIHDRPGRRAVRPTVAEDHRRDGRESFGAVVDRAVQHRLADADVDVGKSGVTVGAQGRQKGRGVGNGDHVGRADKSGRASADSTASNAAR